MIDMNKLAITIAKKEKGNREVDITQIKQIMKILLEELALLEDDDLIALVARYVK